MPVFLVGHITKDGQIAGPKILEHMVDVVLHFEGDLNHIYRILRTQKNRFGATSEIGIYEMQSKVLRAVSNPSEHLISEKEEKLSGHAIADTIEGIRPLMMKFKLSEYCRLWHSSKNHYRLQYQKAQYAFGCFGKKSRFYPRYQRCFYQYYGRHFYCRSGH